MAFNESRLPGEAKFDFSKPDGEGRTILHITASVNNYGILEAVLSRDSLNLDLFHRDERGQTPRTSCEDALSVVYKYLSRKEQQVMRTRMELTKID